MPEPTRLVSSLEMKPTDLKVPRLKPRRSHQVIFGGFPWDFDGILMGISWDFHGILMVFLRDFDGFFTGFWWDFHGNMMGFWWESHGNSGIIDGNLLTNQYHPAQNYPTLLNWKTHILKLKPSNIDNDDLITYQQLLIHQMGLYQKLGTPKSIPWFGKSILVKTVILSIPRVFVAYPNG